MASDINDYMITHNTAKFNSDLVDEVFKAVKIGDNLLCQDDLERIEY